MSAELLEREDLTVYVLAGVPKSFKRKLSKIIEDESRGEGGVVQLDEELQEWVLAQLRDEKRQPRDRTPASKALWRAFSALSAARYHLQDHPAEEDRVRELRRMVEDLWREISPMFEDDTPPTE
ncbi:MAG TPA: hypothetical protein VFU06_14685 [Longimicrobiales bacterium]|nr:hypothetical protein [Longimicrobiales bacterium]